MTSPKKVYVTTSIPYVNSKPHVGHALELIQARRRRAALSAHGTRRLVPNGNR